MDSGNLNQVGPIATNRMTLENTIASQVDTLSGAMTAYAEAVKALSQCRLEPRREGESDESWSKRVDNYNQKLARLTQAVAQKEAKVRSEERNLHSLEGQRGTADMKDEAVKQRAQEIAKQSNEISQASVSTAAGINGEAAESLSSMDKKAVLKAELIEIELSTGDPDLKTALTLIKPFLVGSAAIDVPKANVATGQGISSLPGGGLPDPKLDLEGGGV